MSKHHDLKCHPHFFAAIVAGKKTFEIRRNDRDYRVGDTMTLKEFDPSYGNTGAKAGPFEIVYLMTAEDFPAILPGFVIMGLGGLPEAVTHTLSDDMDVRCNEYKKMAGEVMPRTCALCGLGPCKFKAKET